ncbi:MAG: hypothetical protein ACWA5K_06950 [bacterium]
MNKKNTRSVFWLVIFAIIVVMNTLLDNRNFFSDQWYREAIFLGGAFSLDSILFRGVIFIGDYSVEVEDQKDWSKVMALGIAIVGLCSYFF